MRLEGDNDRLRVRGFRPPHDFVDNMPVSAVDAVEVADAEQRRTEVAGNLVEFVESQHSKSAKAHAVFSRWSLVVGERTLSSFAARTQSTND